MKNLNYIFAPVAFAGVAATMFISSSVSGQNTAPDLTCGSETTTYRVRVETTWSASTHPLNFPPGPHFSPPVASTHPAGESFWSLGGIATDGVKIMAETGNPNPLRAEIEQSISNGRAYAVSVGKRFDSPGTDLLQIEANEDNPYLSVVSMIAPSPDWFIGLSALSLCEDGQWISERIISVNAIDAGTDSGASFTSRNANTAPAGTIHRLQDDRNQLSSRLAQIPFGSFQVTRIR
jgi:hypothetical protein